MRLSPRSITCPRCGMTSYNEHDIRELFCGYCSWWTSDEALAPAMVDGEHKLLCDRPQCIGCKVDVSFLPS